MILSKFQIIVLLSVSPLYTDSEAIALGEVVDVNDKKSKSQFLDFYIFESSFIYIYYLSRTLHFYMVINLDQVIYVPEILVVSWQKHNVSFAPFLDTFLDDSHFYFLKL